jgi:plastocyanin
MAMGARGLLGLVAALLALTPAAAQASTVIEAQTVWRYDMSMYTLAQGDALTFRNADSVSPGPHNVTSQDKGPDGKPIFASDTVPNGKEVPVAGAQNLQAGSYSFFCTVHPFMTATLTVTAAGAPQSPGGSPPSSPPPPSARDTRAPRLHASLIKTSLSRFVKTRRVSARVASDERVALSLRLSVKIGSRVYTLARTEVPGASAGATKTVVLRSSKSQSRRLRGARRAKLTLAVEGRDDAGNVGTARARRTLSR